MKIKVDLKDKCYDILIERGCLNSLSDQIKKLWSKRRLVVITDHQVNKIYGEKICYSLEKVGFTVFLFEFQAGEKSKNLQTASKAWDFCACSGLTRTDGIIALGGGVVGDLAAFVASTYMRGISFIQIATSLTAQVDSSIGGKTGINHPQAKNMIGTFTQPDAVFIDPDCLQTLDKRCLHEGMAEVIKSALIADKLLWEKLEEMSEEDILDEADFLIAHSIEVKRQAIVEDTYDNERRLSLNFGHTIGHALEAINLGELMHGEAVAIGMVELSIWAEKNNLIEKGLTKKIKAMLSKFQLPISMNDEASQLLEFISHDKKIKSEYLQLILVPQIASYQIYPLFIQDIATLINNKKS